jgi:hypothetical protein
VIGDWHAFLERGKRVQSITAEEVQRVARATFRTAGKTVGVLARGAGEAPPEPSPDSLEPAPPPSGRPHPKPHRR